MKRFKVTYYNAIKKTESSLVYKAKSLEQVREYEESIMRVINEHNPFVSVKSVEEVK